MPTNTSKSNVITLGDLTPEERMIQLVRNGETVTIRGYVKGNRTLGSVKSRFASVIEVYNERITGKDFGTEMQIALVDFCRDSLLAVVPGLEYDEADILSGDTDIALDILRKLKWVPELDEMTDPNE